jgi:hypothetical protein
VARITLIFGIALVALGIGFLLATGAKTALIASGFGAPIAILGAVSSGGSEKRRMHLAHAAVMLTLLGAIGGIVMGIIGLNKTGDHFRPLAVTEQFIMGVICILHVLLSVRSFIAVRKARDAAQAEAAASDSPPSTD